MQPRLRWEWLSRLYTTAYNSVRSSSEVLTLRLDRATTQRLAQLAKATSRTRSRLAGEAISRYLDDNAWQVEAIDQGVREAEAGEVVNHDDVVGCSASDSFSVNGGAAPAAKEEKAASVTS